MNGAAGLTGATVAHVMRPALVLPGSTTVREAALAMTRADTTAVLVRDRDGAIAICTDRDLRTRVVAAGETVTVPLDRVTTPHAVHVDPGAAVLDAVLAMTEGGFRHLPVVDPSGAVVGLVEDRDLLAGHALSALHLHRAVLRAPSPEALVDLARRLPATWTATTASGLAPARVGASLAAVLTAVVRRAVDLVAADPPAAAAWLATGALGRREVMPSSPLEHLLVLRDGRPDDAAGTRGAQAVADLLRQAGLCPARHDAPGDRPRQAGGPAPGTLSAWRAAVRDWAGRPGGDGTGHVAALLDARPVHPATNARPLLADVREATAAGTPLGHRLGRAALAADLPSARDVRLHGMRPLDLRRAVVDPVSDLARWAAATAGAGRLGTPERLAAAAAGGVLTAQETGALGAAFSQVQALRLRQQLTDLAAGRAPRDDVVPARLDPLTRRELVELVHVVRDIRNGVRARLGPGPGR